MSLTVNIATRARPNLLLETVKRTLANVSRDDTKLMVSADKDDEATLGIVDAFPKDPRLIVSVKDREDSRGEKYDRALIEAPASVYLPAVDCAPILTPGFDQIVLDKAALFPDGIGVIRTPYVYRRQFPPALQAMTAGYVAKVGCIYSHEYPFWFIDHEVHDMARLIGRYFVANIIVETAPMRPKNTIRLRDLEFWTTYYDLMAIERRHKARAIITGSDFLTPDWLKKDLLDNYQWIEDDARAINDGVRANAKAIEESRGDVGPPDDGYLRKKEQAGAKLAALFERLKAA